MTDQIRELLRDAIPDLPQPPDRLESIGQRVRRARHRRAVSAGTACVIAGVLAVSLATLGQRSTPGPATPTVDCPAPPKYRVGGNLPPADGTFVEPGARWAALCVYQDRDGFPAAKYLLQMKVDRLTTALNGLPAARHCIDPGMVNWGPRSVIVLATPNRPTQVIQLNLGCGVIANGNRERADLRTAADTFYTLYREQIAATIKPGSIHPAACTEQVAANRLMPPDGGRGQAYDPPHDDILRNPNDTTFAPTGPVLPSPLAAATICRYTATSDGLLHLNRTWQGHTELQQLQTQINQTSKRPNGAAQTSCMYLRFQSPPITTLDVMWVTDNTGRALEVRIARKPCSGVNGTVPLPALTATVDQLLNRTP